ncbi:MAG: hypothetical protein ACR2NT_09405 [Acidimicrobiia bacterium]
MSWIAVIVIVVELGFTIVLNAGDFGLPELATVLFVLITALVGLLTARRVHDNPIGRLLLAAALAYASGGLGVTLIEVIDPQNPLFAVTALVGNLAFGLGTGILATFVLLLFSTGRLPSPRWAIVGWMAGVGLTLLLLGIALAPETFAGLPLENPIGLQDSETLLLVLEGGGIYLLFAAILASVASMVVRFRRGTPIERQQLKWVVLSVLVMAAASGSVLVWEFANGVAEVSDDLENVVVTTTLALIPVAIGVAIQRYRLYDIDRIVSRTVTYGLVSASLLAVYAVLVFVLTDLFRLEGDPAVAAATLGVAALFTPLRRRLQTLIDRRFNRSGQTAVRTVESFTARLPAKVDLIELTGDVRAVVGQTMQPAMLSLWLRGEAD